MRKPVFVNAKTKAQIDSIITLLSKSEIPSLERSSFTVQPDTCRVWSETPKTGFLMMGSHYLTPIEHSHMLNAICLFHILDHFQFWFCGQDFGSGASFINKVPRTNLKSVLGHFLGRA